MNPNSIRWMNYAVDIAQRAPQSGRRVGVAVVSDEDELIASAYEGEASGESWYQVLRHKLRELTTTRAPNIYLTINTLSTPCSFDLAELLREVPNEKVYIGL